MELTEINKIAANSTGGLAKHIAKIENPTERTIGKQHEASKFL
jgi:hypothetical protein